VDSRPLKTLPSQCWASNQSPAHRERFDEMFFAGEAFTAATGRFNKTFCSDFVTKTIFFLGR
jgi:hypothetical protein